MHAYKLHCQGMQKCVAPGVAAILTGKSCCVINVSLNLDVDMFLTDGFCKDDFILCNEHTKVQTLSTCAWPSVVSMKYAL